LGRVVFGKLGDGVGDDAARATLLGGVRKVLFQLRQGGGTESPGTTRSSSASMSQFSS
jgi:hypothetical protein